MNIINQITPIILCFNEEDNIERCLDALRDFKTVLVVDSGSHDNTLPLISNYNNVKLVRNEFHSFAQQWNFAINCEEINTDWVLALDADYILPKDLIMELVNIDKNLNFHAYLASFDYAIFGKKLRKSLYPPVVVFFNRNFVAYIDDGHCMRAQVSGTVGRLSCKITHDDRKPIARWLNSQNNYAEIEADLLLEKPSNQLKIQDKLRKSMILTPFIVPFYILTIGFGILDGKRGFYYAFQRGIAECILTLKLLEKKLR